MAELEEATPAETAAAKGFPPGWHAHPLAQGHFRVVAPSGETYKSLGAAHAAIAAGAHDGAAEAAPPLLAFESGEESDHENVCAGCGDAESTAELLVCENCPKVYHHACCSPRLHCTPSGRFVCPACGPDLCARTGARAAATRPVAP